MRKLVFTPSVLLGHDVLALLLRLSLGFVFFAHGTQKVFGLFGGYGLEGTAGWMHAQLGIPEPLAYLACLVEFLAAVFVAVGFLTRIWALALGTIMAVAALTAHSGFFAPEGIEFPLTLLLLASASVLAGPGRHSLDAVIAARLDKNIPSAIS